jgi:hypothetical protein
MPFAISASERQSAHVGQPDSVDPPESAGAFEADEARKARAERVKNMAEEIRKVLAPLVATVRCG